MTSPARQAPPGPRSSDGPTSAATRTAAARFAAGFLALLVAIVALMTLGALVRAHEAGLACPDWPLCFGELVPEMDVKVAFEWSHRALAGSISLVFAALAVAILRRPGLSRAMRSHLLAVAVILAVQIVLGGLTVLELLAAWTVTSHLLVGNAFAVATLFSALRLRDLAHPAPPAPRPSGSLRALLALTGLVLVLQIGLGGLVSSTFAGLACPEWPACNGGRWFPSFSGSVGLHLLHRTNGYLVFVLLVATALSTRRLAGLRGWTAAAAGIAAAQVGVGIANVVLGLPVEVTGLHSLLAATLVLVVATALRRALWPRPASAAH